MSKARDPKRPGRLRPYTKRELLEVYARHPLQQKTILQRVLAARGTLSGLSEMDLAVDDAGEFTDQNHIGGLRFVNELARRTGINSDTRVLDLGCGLGGSARALAATFGCRVHGIDLSPKRCREAIRLTQLVGLGELVTFQCADFRTTHVPRDTFDVLWGQSAWAHIADKRGFLRRWSRALTSRGRIAMEDAFLIRQPTSHSQRALLAGLENQWKSYLITVEKWLELLRAESWMVTLAENHTSAMNAYYAHLIETSPRSCVPEQELVSWRDAVRLARLRLLTYCRFVAERIRFSHSRCFSNEAFN